MQIITFPLQWQWGIRKYICIYIVWWLCNYGEVKHNVGIPCKWDRLEQKMASLWTFFSPHTQKGAPVAHSPYIIPLFEKFCSSNIFVVGSTHKNFSHEIVLTTNKCTYIIATMMPAPSAAKMALLWYLQDGLPDPKGSLSSKVLAAAIVRANQHMQVASETVREEIAINVKAANAEIPCVILHFPNVIYHMCINIRGNIFLWQPLATKTFQHIFFLKNFCTRNFLNYGM